MKKIVFTVMLVFFLEILVGCSAVFMADKLAVQEAAGHQHMITVSQTHIGD